MLQNGDVFPFLTFARTGGGEVRLPDDLAGGFGVILFHRGSWCPYCNTQLAAFARATDEFAEEGIRVVSVSVDDREKSEALVDKHKLSFPVAYGADARVVSATTGAFVNDDPVCLQATGFVISPEGRILTAVYSTRAIGRLMPTDVLSFVRHLKPSVKS
ncbi:TPA: peroxiredoxin family protein [Citrobacter freundii]|nr:peroxiredoxin family protein [Escherichia coli]EFI6640949.1 peroxiredoxin family protein [Escherichia coli]KAA0546469.1 peroxiredoxin family protein [Citrobacter braakii]HAT3429647.1 peroxiredoxin family protein [Citrobacter freundii]